MPTLRSPRWISSVLAFAVVPMLACSEPTAFVGGLSDGASDTGGPIGATSSGGSTTGLDDVPAETSDGGPGGDAAEGSSGSSGDPGGPKLDVGAADDTGVQGDCAPGTDLIYVLFTVHGGLPGEVYRLDPVGGTLDFVSVVDCFPEWELFYGLSVDRAGSVYTFSHDEANHLNRINADGDIGTCHSMFVNDAPPSFLYPGLPFEHVFVALDPAAPEVEEMIVHDWVGVSPGRHGRLTMGDSDASIEVLAETSYLVAHSAGTGDGRLFSLVLDDPDSPAESPRLVELDPADGSIETVITEWPGGLYVAFYAGDLIVFESRGAGLIAAMRYDLDDDDGTGEHEIVEILAPGQFPEDRDMMGAASPTCIPTTPEG